MFKHLITLTLCFILSASNIFSSDDIGQKKFNTNKLIKSKQGNNFTTSHALENPIFIDSWGPESFEPVTFPPAGWIRFTAANPPNLIQWSRITNGTLPPGWFTGYGLEATVPPGGGNAVAFVTWDENGSSVNDLWLVTPKIYNVQTTDSLVFWISKKANYIDNLDIKASKTINNSASAFTITIALLTFGANSNDSAWTRKSYRLNSPGIVNGDNLYFAFREHVPDNRMDGGIIFIDLVSGIGSSVLPVGNISGLVTGRFSLAQNFPNPFNPNTTIYYNLPKSGYVKIKVYDILGNEVASLVDENKLAGTHKIDFSADWLASGVYFYKLVVRQAGSTAGDYTEVRKMMLVK